MSVLTPLAGAACENASFGAEFSPLFLLPWPTHCARLLVSALAAAIAWPVV